MSDDGPAIRLSDLGAQLKRRWRVVVVTTIACLLLAVTVGLLRPPAYTATSVITVNPITSNPFDTSGDQRVNITTERAIVQSADVAQRAREIMGSTAPPHELTDRLGVTSPLDSEILEISATAGKPAEAAATTNAFARGYLDVRVAAARADTDRLIDNLDAQIDELTDQLPSDPAFAGSPTVDALQQQISSLRERRSDLSTIAVNPGRIITEATAAAADTSFGVPIYVAGGLAAGLMLGIGLALVRERMDKLVRSGSRLAEILGSPVLEYRDNDRVDEFLTRVVMRLGIDHDAQLVTVGVLGADRESSITVSRSLTGHLLQSGYRAILAPWAHTAPDDLDVGTSRSLDDTQWEGPANVVVIGAAAQDGIGRTAMLGRRVKKAVIATSPMTTVSAVEQLIEEMSAAGANVDLIVVISPHGMRKAGRADTGSDDGAGAGPYAAESLPRATSEERSAEAETRILRPVDRSSRQRSAHREP